MLKQIVAGMAQTLKVSPFTGVRYLGSLKLGYQLLNRSRRQGLMSLEADVEDPINSAIFNRGIPEEYSRPALLLRQHAHGHQRRPSLRTRSADRIRPRCSPSRRTQPVASLTSVADSLPGLGIVAAMLGVVITMGALGGPPEEIGHKVAAALVGTFIGIVL